MPIKTIEEKQLVKLSLAIKRQLSVEKSREDVSHLKCTRSWEAVTTEC